MTGTSVDLTYRGPVVAFDLDDTLYKERDYVFSAIQAIAYTLFPGREELVIRKGIHAFLNGENLLDSIDTTRTEDMLKVYRAHLPALSLSEGAEALLTGLQASGVKMALITDGRSLTQRNKLAALELTPYFAPEDVLISEETGADKARPDNFKALMRRYPEASRFIYVADNPAKDFLWPNRLGFTTICLLDDKGINIHPQSLENPEPDYAPARTIHSLSEIKNLLTTN